jgi:hypothetical protein
MFADTGHYHATSNEQRLDRPMGHNRSCQGQVLQISDKLWYFFNGGKYLKLGANIRYVPPLCQLKELTLAGTTMTHSSIQHHLMVHVIGARDEDPRVLSELYPSSIAGHG